MVAFRTPTDIANRALQHCGAKRIDAVLGFTENSKNASEVASCYDKLREAELQRRVWTFATRRQILRAIDSNTMLLTPSLWGSTTTYFVGSIVADQAGSLWISNTPSNLNNDPLLTTAWEPYFGPRAIPLHDSGISYFAGEVVYTASGNGTSRIYLSLQSDNDDVPATATAYDATVTYFKNQVVTYLSVAYMSLTDLNTANTPSSAPALFDVATTYAAGDPVGGSDGVIYTSIGSGNVGNDPVTTTGYWTDTGVLNPWTTVFTGGAGSDKWLQIGGAEFPLGVGLTTLNIVYPLGTGPSTQTNSSNAFMLPAGYLRKAQQNPKNGVAALGGPSGVSYDDWLIEGNYLITAETGPIRLRFVANITDVSRMHTMFCEGLAARVALSICDSVTQDKGQFQIVAKVYNEWKDQASTFDGIENGYADPPDDDYVSVRC